MRNSRPTLSPLKKEKYPCKWSTSKDQKSNYSIPLDLEKNCERLIIKYDILNYGVTMDLQKKSFIESGESCRH